MRSGDGEEEAGAQEQRPALSEADDQGHSHTADPEVIAVIRPPFPAIYLPTGDRAMVLAWARVETRVADVEVAGPGAILVVEDGSLRQATVDQIQIEWRWDINGQRWVDVSGIPLDWELEDDGADSDQGDEDDGRAPVSGLVPDADGASPGDPLDEEHRGPGSVDAEEGS